MIIFILFILVLWYVHGVAENRYLRKIIEKQDRLYKLLYTGLKASQQDENRGDKKNG